jgi:aryl-alcohol dehydrogenase-like predicted oxidoreductase
MWSAVDAYLDIAKRYAIDPVQLAIAWTLTRPFMASSIIGATSTEQLSTVLGATEITLGDDVLAEIEAAHRAHPMPY